MTMRKVLFGLAVGLVFVLWHGLTPLVTEDLLLRRLALSRDPTFPRSEASASAR